MAIILIYIFECFRLILFLSACTRLLVEVKFFIFFLGAHISQECSSWWALEFKFVVDLSGKVLPRTRIQSISSFYWNIEIWALVYTLLSRASMLATRSKPLRFVSMIQGQIKGEKNWENLAKHWFFLRRNVPTRYLQEFSRGRSHAASH